MSDVQQGPGWWRASDGKWYAPEQHPNYHQHLAAHRAAMAESESVGATPSSSSTMFVVAVVGAVMIIVGALLPWASVQTVFGSMSMNGIEGDGVLTLGGGVVIAGLLVIGRRNRGAAGVAFAGAVIVGLVALYDMSNLAEVTAEVERDGFARAAIGPGLWATLVGAGIAALGSLAVAAGRD